VWNLLDENRHTHNCHFWLLRGAVSDRPVNINGIFYSTRSVPINGSRGAKGWLGPQDLCTAEQKLPASSQPTSIKRSYTYEEIQEVAKLRFTALLIDCEGCITSLFAGNSAPLGELLRDVQTIILEADMPVGALDCTQDCVDYTVWIAKLKEIGLEVVDTVQDPVYPKIFHYVFQRKVDHVM
jgi:hypothetical protein